MQQCPCGSNKSYQECCEPFHKQTIDAPSAESLMRARYSAFVKHEIDYVESTHVPGTKDFDKEEASTWAKNSNWLGLEVIKTERGIDQDTKGSVEFRASYKDNENNDYLHHENAEFTKQDGKWYYVRGSIMGVDPYTRNTPKVGRNDPCTCGSGKKFKKCCGAN